MLKNGQMNKEIAELKVLTHFSSTEADTNILKSLKTDVATLSDQNMKLNED